MLKRYYQSNNRGRGLSVWYHTVTDVTDAGLAKSLARRPGAIVFSSRATKMYHRPARRATLNTGQRVFKALKSFKYVKWHKKSLNCNFKRSYSWGWKGKNRNMAGLNFKRQLCHWIRMSLCECISEGNRLSSETYHWHFHLILPIKCLMKQRLLARCCFVYSRYRGNCFISAAALKAPPRGREWICISKKPILCLDQRPIVHIDPCFYAANTQSCKCERSYWAF